MKKYLTILIIALLITNAVFLVAVIRLLKTNYNISADKEFNESTYLLIRVPLSETEIHTEHIQDWLSEQSK